jgi:thiamine biosynthesis lipoprotein
MRSSSRLPVVERARPLLGTLVAIRVRGLPESRAHRAIDAAFAEIEHIHARMSFHEADSDVSRLNREAFHRPVTVNPRTAEVLRLARQMGEHSRGRFDITVAAQLVDWGLLPPPDCSGRPDPRGCWRDVELLAGGAIRFRRAVWIDLGGIAKGYAVDRAIECLRGWGAPQCSVNAGGDLRILGPEMEGIRLDWGSAADPILPILELESGSVASSSGRPARLRHGRRFHGPHVDGRRRDPVGTRSFVCVVAERCVVADALTKVVLAQGTRSQPVLRRYGASAHLYRPGHGWRSLATR